MLSLQAIKSAAKLGPAVAATIVSDEEDRLFSDLLKAVEAAVQSSQGTVPAKPA